MIIAKLITLAFVVTWASCTIGCTEVKNSSTGGYVEQPELVAPVVITPEPSEEIVPEEE